MKQKNNIGFGFRGWILILYQAIGMYTFTIMNSFGQGVQASYNAQMLGWSPTTVSLIYTVTILLSVVFNIACSRKIANANILRISVIFMFISVICILGIATVQFSETLWLIIFAVGIFFSNVGAMLVIGILMGQWFPRRKGTVMGIATLSFPITAGVLLSIFAGNLFAKGPFMAYLPFVTVTIVVTIIAAFLIKNYPEQCGAFRDNDRNMTPEKAREIMEAEIAAKKNSVWTLKNTFKCREFWLMTIPIGILLATSVGASTQIMNILSYYPDFYAKHGALTASMTTVVACAGSYLIGLFDTRFGTKKAVILSCAIAAVSGFVGLISTQQTLIAGFLILCVFMGSSSNFCVSMAAQYWKREDFPSVFGYEVPISNAIQAFGPTIIAFVGFGMGFHMSFGVIGVLGVIALVLILLFNPKHVQKVDEEYKQKIAK